MKERTEMFWYLQLQFLNMTNVDLHNLFWAVRGSVIYKKNKYTEKLSNIVQLTYSYDNDTRDCLATHLALQLAGIEE